MGRMLRFDDTDRRRQAKRRWPQQRALGILIRYYRTVDRLSGLSPRGGKSWSEPVQRTLNGFYPGSVTFNATFESTRGKRREGDPLAQARWTIAQMAKLVRRQQRDAVSSNGRTSAFGSENRGSNPRAAAKVD